ncbi:hypothetical protein [Actinoplanes sp. NPDC049802]|uniref:hypothetical protein n=1 Tax=Actinoplanes sp. NPDC049802 TaxID=3154742 RepID=UPI0033EFCEA0
MPASQGWGPAEQIAAEPAARGVDRTDPEAVDEAMRRLNAERLARYLTDRSLCSAAYVIDLQRYNPAMRTVFAFPASSREKAIELLTEHLPERSRPWVMNGALYIDIEDEGNGTLYVDWEPEALAVLDAAAGRRPHWAVQIDISGRIDGTADVRQLLELLLSAGGVAFDDYTNHAWSLPEIKNGSTFSGLGFFDFKNYRGGQC